MSFQQWAAVNRYLLVPQTVSSDNSVSPASSDFDSSDSDNMDWREKSRFYIDAPDRSTKFLRQIVSYSKQQFNIAQEKRVVRFTDKSAKSFAIYKDKNIAIAVVKFSSSERPQIDHHMKKKLRYTSVAQKGFLCLKQCSTQKEYAAINQMVEWLQDHVPCDHKNPECQHSDILSWECWYCKAPFCSRNTICAGQLHKNGVLPVWKRFFVDRPLKLFTTFRHGTIWTNCDTIIGETTHRKKYRVTCRTTDSSHWAFSPTLRCIRKYLRHNTRPKKGFFFVTRTPIRSEKEASFQRESVAAFLNKSDCENAAFYDSETIRYVKFCSNCNTVYEMGTNCKQNCTAEVEVSALTQQD